MYRYYDMLGNEISIDDNIVYGKSSRYNPIKLGVVHDINEKGIVVLGEGNSKTGLLQDTKTRVLSLTAFLQAE